MKKWKIVKTLTDSDKYLYSGHSALMGKVQRDFQNTDYVLRLFGEKVPAARRAYRTYVERGISQGRRPELVGGGLISSAGGWSVVKAMRRAHHHHRSGTIADPHRAVPWKRWRLRKSDISGRMEVSP